MGHGPRRSAPDDIVAAPPGNSGASGGPVCPFLRCCEFEVAGGGEQGVGVVWPSRACRSSNGPIAGVIAGPRSRLMLRLAVAPPVVFVFEEPLVRELLHRSAEGGHALGGLPQIHMVAVPSCSAGPADGSAGPYPGVADALHRFERPHPLLAFEGHGLVGGVERRPQQLRPWWGVFFVLVRHRPRLSLTEPLPVPRPAAFHPGLLDRDEHFHHVVDRTAKLPSGMDVHPAVLSEEVLLLFGFLAEEGVSEGERGIHHRSTLAA